jgi:hypothetical protein
VAKILSPLAVEFQLLFVVEGQSVVVVVALLAFVKVVKLL